MFRLSFNWILTLAIATTLVACAEGGTGGTGLTDTAVTVGVIKEKTATTVKINNQDYITNNAAVTINGTGKPVTDVQVGMIAKISAKVLSAQERIANTIDISSTLIGPIEQSDGMSTLKVNGLTVTINNDTKRASQLNLTDLTVGKRLSVMGFAQADGKIIATYLDDDSGNSKRIISGFISGLDTVNKTFNVGDVKISYASTNASNAQQSQIALQRYVKIEGSFDNNQIFIASEIEFEYDFEFETNSTEHESSSENRQIELEGYLTQAVVNNDFVLWGKTVRITSSTVFEHGTQSDLIAGKKVHVKGAIENGILVATVIEIESTSSTSTESESSTGSGSDDKSTETDKSTSLLTSNNATIESTVISTNPAISAVAIAGFDNLPVSIDANTRLIGIISFDQLRIGDSVRLLVDTNTRIAIEFKLVSRETSDDIEIYAPVTQINSTSIIVFGQEIDLQHVETGRDSLASYLSSLTVGKTIHLKGKWNGSTVVWKEIS